MAETQITCNLSTFPEMRCQKTAALIGWQSQTIAMKSEMHVHLVEVMGIEINLSCVPGICNFDTSGMT